MAHEVETMAYAGEVPWHGLGKPVPADLTPKQMLKSAGLDWTVEKVPAFVEINGKQVPIDRAALVRSSDHRILSTVTSEWNPLQNLEAFEFFNEFIEVGDMEMHTAGSLKNGEIVFALAKVKDSFSLFRGKDVVDSYLLFTNPHRFGKSIDIRFTPIRVVCWNTISMALASETKNQAAVSHRVKFDASQVKETMGLAHQKLDKYKEAAQFLSSKKIGGEEDIVSYFKLVFPVATNKEDSKRSVSKSAKIAMEIMDTQPGASLGEGTWWQAFNGATYTVDHLLGRSVDTRMQSAWFGGGKDTKARAMSLALEMANAA